jgi:uncharacterized phage protein (TIGR02218 family)
MRSISPGMATSIATSTTLARIWRITKPDGTIIRLTDGVSDVVMGSETFVAKIGFTASSTYISSLPGSAQSAQIVCVTDTLGVSRQDIVAGKMTGCPAQLSVVDWKNAASGEMIMLKGIIGRIQVNNRSRATVEVLPRTAQTVTIGTELYSVACRNSLGNLLCTVPIDNFKTAFTVTSLATRQAFTVSGLNNQADNYYSIGHVIWQGGLNDKWISDVRIALANLQVQLFFPPPNRIVVGDAGIIWPGCDLQQLTCLNKFNNLLNFRAEPYRPQWNVLGTIAAPVTPAVPSPAPPAAPPPAPAPVVVEPDEVGPLNGQLYEFGGPIGPGDDTEDGRVDLDPFVDFGDTKPGNRFGT